MARGQQAARQRRPGPQRPTGAPVGPEQVRRAVLDAAAHLFAHHGVDAVSLREIAAAADVQLALIARYVGTRDELVAAVLQDLTEQVARFALEHPTEQHPFDAGSPAWCWTRVLAHQVITGGDLAAATAYNPVATVAQVAQEEYGLDEAAARLRAAQVMASALGWRIFEDYLVAAGALEGFDRQVLRDELTATHRRLAATPWPSPPDPRRRR